MCSVNPLFSIIIPIHNRAHLVGKTIQSVLQQRFKDFELILVNDGSTDSTESLIQTFKDPRIHYIKIANSERGAARNVGAEMARGLYFNFFDSDDIMLDNHLETASTFIKNHHSPSWFHVGYEVRDEQGKLLLTEVGTRIKPEIRLIESNYLGCNSIFIERDLFLSSKFNANRKLASSEDWELWLRLISENELMTCSEVTFQMLHHPNRSILTIPVDRVVERDTFMLQELFRNESFVNKFKNRLPLFEADRYTFFALCLILASRRKEAIDYLWKSINKTPSVFARKRFWACIKLLISTTLK